jgi:tetratricopeptide (TPR) repeat protein
MSAHVTRFATALASLTLALLLVPASSVQAQTVQVERASGTEQTHQHRPTKTRDSRQGLLTERTHRDLTRIYDQIGDEKYQEALSALGSVLNRTGLSDYERAVIVQARGHVQLMLERYDAALRDFEEVIRADALPNQAHFSMIYQTAQIYIVQEQFERGLRTLDDWFAYTDTVTASAYELQASALAQLNRYREAIVAIDRAIALSNSPKDNWYQLKLAMHFELKEYPQAAAVLQILIERDPSRKAYWTQLSSIYMAMDDQRRALSVMALAHRKDLLDRESDWVQLYQLYSLMEVPYKAAQVLQEGLSKNIIEATQKRWEDLGNTWYTANEMDRALAAYERAAALSADGKIDLQRAYILVDQEKWPDAEQALAEAVRKGGLDRQCNAYLLLGMAQFEQNKRSAAQASFNRSATEERCRSAATQWLRHLEETRPRPQQAAEEQVGPE